MKKMLMILLLTLLSFSVGYSQKNHTHKEGNNIKRENQRFYEGTNKLDKKSIKSILPSKLFDENDLLKSYIGERWNNTSMEWENYVRYTAIHNNNNYLTEELWEIWNGSEWVNSDRGIQEVDENGNWTDWTYSSWNGQSWVEEDRETQEYDENGNWIEWIDYDLDGDVWVFNDRETQEYDESGNWIEWIDYDLDGVIWVFNERETQEYNNLGNRINWYEFSWNGSWVNSERTEIFYNENNLWDEWINYNWSNSAWVEDERAERFYYDNGLWSEWIYYEWDGTVWANSERETITYNDQDLWDEWIGEIWDGTNWSNSGRETQTYDANLNSDVYTYFEYVGNDWQNNERYTYTYEVITGIENENTIINSYNLSNNFPNPFNPSTQIQYQIPESGNVSLKVFDLLGREIATLVSDFHNKGLYKINFNAADLPSGFYLYQINAGNFSETKKMLLLK